MMKMMLKKQMIESGWNLMSISMGSVKIKIASPPSKV